MKPVLGNWTIVIVGRWNVSIFSPEWLGKNLFENKELLIDVPMEPGLPLRLTGDNVLFIPHADRVVFGARETTNDHLQHMEDLAVKLLDTLPHTPVGAVGINFGYEVEPLPEEMKNAFKNPHAQEYVDHELLAVSKSFKWGCKYDDQIVNIEFVLKEDKLLVTYNFHTDAVGTEKAKEAISGKVLAHKAFGERILNGIYGLALEDVYDERHDNE